MIDDYNFTTQSQFATFTWIIVSPDALKGNLLGIRSATDKDKQ